MKKVLSVIFSLIMMGTCAFAMFAATGCAENDYIHPDYKFTQANLYGVDDLGREFKPVSGFNKNELGIFYFTWHGQHGLPPDPYDIGKILDEDPALLWDVAGSSRSPQGALHWWAEPMYGYYNSTDKFVIRKHMEMLSLAGVDYIAIDATNDDTYDAVWIAICEVLEEMYDQGIAIPKVVFYVLSTSAACHVKTKHLYDVLYEPGRFKNTWYTPKGKPMIIAIRSEFDRNHTFLRDEFFDMRSGQNPQEKDALPDGMPWIDFHKPQRLHTDYMNVSVAQNVAGRFSDTANPYTLNPQAGWGRGYTKANGFNYDYERNYWGDNFQEEWNTALNNPDVKRTMIIGFNQWTVQKIPENGQVYFADEFNMEYSTDIEPMKGGYGDNYFMQFLDNSRRFKSKGASNGHNVKKTLDIMKGETAFKDIQAYMDARNEIQSRNNYGAWQHVYTDNSNRNDIIKTKIAHDNNNLYVNVECAYEILRADGENWMNLYINVLSDRDKGFAGYNFIVNRLPDIANGKSSVERIDSGFNPRDRQDCEIFVSDKSISYKIPFSALGLEAGKTPAVALKAADNIQNQTDPMDFYVSGDCAPIGKISYAYGVKGGN